ncbi:MAG: glycosyltransferase family 39 protein [Pseudomonadales bacterium]|nr:glycosyltransferase family 39 protein [Pseudomonadales bacterium]
MKILLRYSPLLGIIALALMLRLYRVSYPLLDWHSWRQADTASVTREYTLHGIDLLHPTYHDLSNIPSGLDNPEGYRMVEFPIVNGVLAVIVTTLHLSDVVVASRLFSMLCSLVTLVSIFGVVKMLSGKKIAYLSAVVFAVLPYSVYYSRTVLPEPAMLAAITTSLACFVWSVEKNKPSGYFYSAVLFTLALLLKPFVVFFAPVYMVLFVHKHTTHWRSYWPALLFLLAVLPLWWWRSWIAQFPEGIPASDWLFNGNGIRLRPAWFRWIFFERISKLMLGYVGVVFVVLAPFVANKKELLVYGSWWAGMFAYLIVIATGNVQHDYYQVLLTPILSITVAFGIYACYSFISSFNQISTQTRHVLSLAATISLSLLMLVGAGMQVRGYFNVNHWEYDTAGAVVDQVVPANAQVIAPNFGDTSFLFQTKRVGWPIGYEIEQKRKLGATHYVSTSYDDEARELEERYFVLEKTQEYIIIDLTKPKQ